jgi:hypothetical protein
VPLLRATVRPVRWGDLHACYTFAAVLLDFVPVACVIRDTCIDLFSEMAGNGKAITLHFQKLSLQKDDLEKKLQRQQKRIDDAELEIGELTAKIYGLRVAKKGQGGAQADREQTKKADKEVRFTWLFKFDGLAQLSERLLAAPDIPFGTRKTTVVAGFG